MNKEFIPYEQALALKELGFDEPCIAFYTQNAYGDGKELQWFRKPNDCNGDYVFISAPLYQQAFRWFREKYKLHSRVDIQDVELDWYSFEILEVRDGDYNNDLHTDMNFKSHEEAELECLKKLIEIIKKIN
jgi:hypothetical protein